MKIKFIWEVQTKVTVTTFALRSTLWNKWHFSSGLEAELVPISRTGQLADARASILVVSPKDY